MSTPRYARIHAFVSRHGYQHNRVLPLPVGAALLFLGIENLFLLYVKVAFLPVDYKPPHFYFAIHELWDRSINGMSVPTALAAIHLLVVLYLWLAYRRIRDWQRGVAFLGAAALFVAQQVFLLQIRALPHVAYDVYRLVESPESVFYQLQLSW